MWWRVIFFLLIFCSTSGAATYYVSTTGDDADTGGIGDPWRTVQHAMDNVSAGDTVNIAAGTYYETLQPSVNGTALSRIIFTGAVDGNNDPTTIINGGTETVTWVHDPSFDDPDDETVKVYTATFSSMVYSIWIDGYSLPMFGPGYMASEEQFSSCTTGWNYNWRDWIAFKRDKEITTYQTYPTSDIAVWDTMYGVWGYVNVAGTHKVYLRLRNGDDPNLHTIRVNITSSAANNINTSYGVRFKGGWGDYYTIQNVEFQNGAYRGFWTDADGVILDNIRSKGSSIRVQVDGGSITVQNSILEWYPYGKQEMGAWSSRHSETYGQHVRYGERYFWYRWSKCVEGDKSRGNGGFWVNGCAAYCIIQDSIIRNGRVGAATAALSAGSSAIIRRNTVQNHSSGAFYTDTSADGTSHFLDNDIHNSNIGFRFGDMRGAYAQRTVYIRRNTFWNHHKEGSMVYVHTGGTSAITVDPDIYYEYNKVIGGRWAWENSYNIYDNGGLPGLRYRYNIINSHDWMRSGATWFTTAGMIGDYSGNWIGGTYPYNAPGGGVTLIPWWDSSNNPKVGGVYQTDQYLYDINAWQPLSVWIVPPGTFDKSCVCDYCTGHDS